MEEYDVVLTLVEGVHNKFWRAEVIGTILYVTYGRIGSPKGATQVQSHSSAALAKDAANRRVREKLDKGYRRWTGDKQQFPSARYVATNATPTPTRQTPTRAADTVQTTRATNTPVSRPIRTIDLWD